MKVVFTKTMQEKHRKHSLTALRMKYRLNKAILKNFSSEDLLHPMWMKALLKLKEAILNHTKRS